MILCGNLSNQSGVNLSNKIWIIKKLFVSLYNYTDIQNGQMFNAQMWVKVDTENEVEKRMFEVIGTGQNFDDTNKKYVGTYQEGPFVWHVFEKDLDN